MIIRATSDTAEQVIRRVLELSADAQIERRRTAKGTPEYHRLTGTIIAYGKVLALLTAARRREEFYAVTGGPGARALGLPEPGTTRVH